MTTGKTQKKADAQSFFISSSLSKREIKEKIKKLEAEVQLALDDLRGEARLEGKDEYVYLPKIYYDANKVVTLTRFHVPKTLFGKWLPVDQNYHRIKFGVQQEAVAPNYQLIDLDEIDGSEDSLAELENFKKQLEDRLAEKQAQRIALKESRKSELKELLKTVTLQDKTNAEDSEVSSSDKNPVTKAANKDLFITDVQLAYTAKFGSQGEDVQVTGINSVTRDLALLKDGAISPALVSLFCVLVFRKSLTMAKTEFADCTMIGGGDEPDTPTRYEMFVYLLGCLNGRGFQELFFDPEDNPAECQNSDPLTWNDVQWDAFVKDRASRTQDFWDNKLFNYLGKHPGPDDIDYPFPVTSNHLFYKGNKLEHTPLSDATGETFHLLSKVVQEKGLQGIEEKSELKQLWESLNQSQQYLILTLSDRNYEYHRSVGIARSLVGLLAGKGAAKNSGGNELRFDKELWAVNRHKVYCPEDSQITREKFRKNVAFHFPPEILTLGNEGIEKYLVEHSSEFWRQSTRYPNVYTCDILYPNRDPDDPFQAYICISYVDQGVDGSGKHFYSLLLDTTDGTQQRIEFAYRGDTSELQALLCKSVVINTQTKATHDGETTAYPSFDHHPERLIKTNADINFSLEDFFNQPNIIRPVSGHIHEGGVEVALKDLLHPQNREYNIVGRGVRDATAMNLVVYDDEGNATVQVIDLVTQTEKNNLPQPVKDSLEHFRPTYRYHSYWRSSDLYKNGVPPFLKILLRENHLVARDSIPAALSDYEQQLAGAWELWNLTITDIRFKKEQGLPISSDEILQVQFLQRVLDGMDEHLVTWLNGDKTSDDSYEQSGYRNAKIEVSHLPHKAADDKLAEHYNDLKSDPYYGLLFPIITYAEFGSFGFEFGAVVSQEAAYNEFHFKYDLFGNVVPWQQKKRIRRLTTEPTQFKVDHPDD